MNDIRQNSEITTMTSPNRRRVSWPLVILAALFIVVPFFTWYGTWFGRKLSDDDIAKYLADNQNPRHIQHALSLIEARIEGGDASAKKFYPQVIAQSKNPMGEVRKTAAWVMGQDNNSEDFHSALLDLLKDGEPLVRRNAALQLVRFGDASGRPELRAMLEPFEVKSPMTGTIVSILGAGSKIRAGALLARIRDPSGVVQEFRSPLDGAIATLAAKEGDSVTSGQIVASLIPDQATVMDSLRAFAYVGTKDDLSLIQAYTQAVVGSETAQQATLTIKAIQSR